VARSDDDMWDVTEGVGVTALAVATSRAAETERDEAPFRDPFARPFLNAPARECGVPSPRQRCPKSKPNSIPS
jgi:O-methyltransferase involved in polyketide biosynthesis